ncbi:hypothetical protein MGYG_01311 [Nannizzia gypsea CBS 118893]|uniref:Uncharacterized protein n=1 Tax=Arthroderma gypseum (strain ATCC MYA-4604 / CBS 118893) TaxID=535722 RepID=E5R029_ARTGP|nr:hypothetical protein MGYG_01311 [Nannizzia gypsea CBS 118893]EFQ98278.1 hypothetical protein MGYG_01311 [Nannizzia gypsea CBS 118893]
METPQRRQPEELRRKISTSSLLRIPTTDEEAPVSVHFSTDDGSKSYVTTPPCGREGSHSPTPSNPPPSPRDELPKDFVALDGLLNYHLSQLDRIKSEIKEHNTTLDQLGYTLANMSTRPEVQYAAMYMNWRLQGVRNARNLLAKFVAFHLQEIDRISALKLEMGGNDVLEICRNLPSSREWNDMFSY